MTIDQRGSSNATLLVAGLATVGLAAAGLLVWWLVDTREPLATIKPTDNARIDEPHPAEPDEDPVPVPVPGPVTATEMLAVQAIATAATPGDIYARACALCHGVAGAGNAELRTPSIAGQPAWYLRSQLRKFRGGQRGSHVRDTAGKQMTIVARALPEKIIDPLAKLISGMPPFPTQKTLEGDIENGRMVYAEQCLECHRYNGRGELVFRSSPLTSFQDWYLANEFEEFRTGLRGQDPADRHGVKMREVASYLDAKSRRDVIAYIVELASEYPPGK